MMNQLLTFVFSGALLLCTILGFCFLLLHLQQHHKHKQLQLDGLVKLNIMRKLLTHMQKHRGLSNGILHGEDDLKARLDTVTDKINQLNREITDMYPDLTGNERWQAMQDHWQRLAVDYCNLNIRNNLEQHNKLVLNLLYLINDIAFDNKLHQFSNKQNESIQFLWQELLFTAESIAQIRALGTGIAAAKICTRAERIRLNYLCQSLEQSINIQNNPDYLLKISYLLKIIDNEIVINRPTIKAERFFNIATESIDMILANFDNQLNHVEYQLYTTSNTDTHTHKKAPTQ